MNMGYVKLNDLVISDTIPVNRYTQRSILNIGNGISVWVDEHLPKSVFSKPVSTVVIDYIVKIDDVNERIVKKHSGYINPNIYTQEGYGYICFTRKTKGLYDMVDLAIDFLIGEKDNLSINEI